MSKNVYLSNRIIQLKNATDIYFSKIAQDIVITGAKLPSGFKIPNVGDWIVSGHYIINITDDIKNLIKVKNF